MENFKLDTLENIEKVMPQLNVVLANDDKSMAVGPKVVAPFAEAIETLARELRLLRDRCK
jgi:hypothetical protein